MCVCVYVCVFARARMIEDVDVGTRLKDPPASFGYEGLGIRVRARGSRLSGVGFRV